MSESVVAPRLSIQDALESVEPRIGRLGQGRRRLSTDLPPCPTDPAVTIPPLMEALAFEPVADLSANELRELTAAAAWYAKRHEHIVSELADDRSAGAVAERERYLTLHSALWKLGVRLRLPDGLDRPAR